MADIELVIKISEEMYKNIQSENFWLDSGLTLSNAYDSIKNGIPLPKRHGRVVDISKIEYLKAIHDAKYGKISWSEAIKQIKNSAPTIIDADTEESEEQE